jgi:hypothetical protein
MDKSYQRATDAKENPAIPFEPEKQATSKTRESKAGRRALAMSFLERNHHETKMSSLIGAMACHP